MTAIAGGLRGATIPAVAWGWSTTKTDQCELYSDSPMGVAEVGTLRVVTDARLDNLHELSELLELPGGSSEACVVLAGFRRWGTRAFSRLLGDFAVALWDGRQAALWLVRDPFGVRPLFYSRSDPLCFASHLSDLCTVPGLTASCDERAMLDHLGGFPPDEARTCFADICRLTPGSLLCVRGGTRQSERFYDLSAVAPHEISDDDAAGIFREKLERAVARRTVGHRRCGVLLSGGLDSSAVAVLAPSPIVALSGAFEGSCDELRFQRAVVSRIRAEHVQRDIVSTASEESVADRIFQLREPSFVGGHWIVDPLLRIAVDRGLEVILSGVDGDRVVSHGQGLLEELAGERQWLTLAQEVRDGCSATASVSRFLRKAIVTSTPSDWVRHWDARRLRKELRTSPAFSLLRPALLERHSVVDRMGEAFRRPFTTREGHLMALQRSDRSRDLELLAALGRHWGVRVHHPFFDRELVEFCLGLPGRLKRRKGQARFILRQALARTLPSQVAERPDKTDFEPAFERWATAVLARKENSFDIENLDPFLDVRMLKKHLGGSNEKLPVDLVWRCVIGSAWLGGSTARSGISDPSLNTVGVSST